VSRGNRGFGLELVELESAFPFCICNCDCDRKSGEGIEEEEVLKSRKGKAGNDGGPNGHTDHACVHAVPEFGSVAARAAGVAVCGR
jgi:hypothetical protein